MAVARVCLKLSQYRDGLLRKRHDVLLRHLPAARRNPPFRLLPIEDELRSFSGAQFARANEHEGCELEPGSNRGLTLIPVDCSKEFGDLLGSVIAARPFDLAGASAPRSSSVG